jgi:hypothetical protein
MARNSLGQQGPYLGISGSLLIVMRYGHAQDLCPHESFLSPMPLCLCLRFSLRSASASVSAFALPLPPFQPSRLVGLDFIVSRTYALQAYHEYQAIFLAPPSSRLDLLPSLPLPTRDHRPPSLLSLLSISLSLLHLHVLSLASDRPSAMVFAVWRVRRSVGSELPSQKFNLLPLRT